MKIRMTSPITVVLIGLLLIISSCSTNQQTPNRQIKNKQTTNQQTPNRQMPESPPAKLVEIIFEVDVAQGVEGYMGAFKPPTAYVIEGTTVTWKNEDSFRFNTHEVTSRDGLFDVPLAVGQSFNYTFTTPGTFKYYCKTFDNMMGEIVVE